MRRRGGSGDSGFPRPVAAGSRGSSTRPGAHTGRYSASVRSNQMLTPKPSLHMTLNVHLVRGRVYWALLNRHLSGDTLIVRGVLDDPYPAEANIRGSVVLEAAYAAHQALAGKPSDAPA